MWGFNQTVTIYNKRYDTTTRRTTWPKTVIKRASWQGVQRISTGKHTASSDKYSVRIPLTGFPPGFLKKDEYNALQIPTGHWTVQNGDVVVLGEAPDVVDGITEITSKYMSFTVTAVNVGSMTRPLPHLRLEGK